MKKTMLAMVAALTAVLTAGAADAPAAKAKSGFARPNPAALKALKAAMGKPFSAGWVFVDGKYVPPPYKVERYGTVLRINGIQVTGDVVPWEEFIKTQAGVKVTKSGPTPAAEGAEPAAAESAPEPEPTEEELDDAWENSLDDLFDDEPTTKKSSSKSSKGSGYKPRPKKPAVTVTYTFEGEFKPNDKTNAMLARINATRTKLDQHLRSGGFCYFSSRYAGVRVDGRAAKQMMDKLPGLMKQSKSAEALAQAIRSNGFVYLSAPFIADLFKNRNDYLQLMQRNEKERSQY